MIGRSVWIIVALTALGVVGTAFSGSVSAALGVRSSNGLGTMSALYGSYAGNVGAMMGNSGGYGMMPGAFPGGKANTSAAFNVSLAEVTKLGNAVTSGATVDVSRNRVLFTGRDITLDVVGSPRGQKDETFRIAGLVNPTIVMPEGAVVHVEFVNADPDMLHNFVVTAAQPPFAYLVMMKGAPAFAGATTPFLTAFSGGTAQSIRTSFVAAAAGEYTYLCTVPGHAQSGMYGHLIVQ